MMLFICCLFHFISGYDEQEDRHGADAAVCPGSGNPPVHLSHPTGHEVRSNKYFHTFFFALSSIIHTQIKCHDKDYILISLKFWWNCAQNQWTVVMN